MGKLSLFVQNGALSHCKPAIQLCRKISSKTNGAYTVDFICVFDIFLLIIKTIKERELQESHNILRKEDLKE